MFDDLDATLQMLLDDAGAPPELRLADVSFQTPGKDYAPATETVNLFLREVREHAELRDPAPVIEQANGGFVRRQPPLRVECAYLVTTWADPSQAAAVKVLAEHRLLGQALAWLRRFPTIPASYLQGTLASQEIPLPTVVARPGGGRDAGEFWTWSALGVAPRPSLDLSVTISMAIDLTVPEGPPVVTSELRLGQADATAEVFEVAGTVRRSLAAVPGAQVALEPGGASAVSDELGRFRFAGLAAGSYDLSTTETGQPVVSTSVSVPATTANAYDVNLPP